MAFHRVSMIRITRFHRRLAHLEAADGLGLNGDLGAHHRGLEGEGPEKAAQNVG